MFFLVQTGKMVKKKPVFGAISSLCMPKRSHEKTETVVRPRGKLSEIKEAEVPQQQNSITDVVYQSFNEFSSRILKLKFQVFCMECEKVA